MLTAIVGTLSSLVIGGLGLYFKYFAFAKKDPAQVVANTDHEMLKDAIDRPSATDVSNDMRDGKF